MAKRIMIRDIQTAVELYNFPEIGTAEIMQMFQCSRSKAVKLKALAKQEQDKQGKMTMSPYNVHTKSAFAAWHLDIIELEKSLNRLKKHNMKVVMQ